MSEEQLTREEQAAREIGVTAVSPRVARVVSAGFLLTLAVVPIVQWGLELGEFARGQRPTPWPSAADILSAPTVAQRTWSATRGHAGRRVLEANAQLLAEINRYEDMLAERAFTTTQLLGPTRRRLAGWAGWGTEQAWIGRDGWLFFRPDIDYLTGRGFLDPAVLARRARGGREFSERRHPNPLPAILDFHRQLKSRGITLVVVPTPSKAIVHHEKLWPGIDTDPLRNGILSGIQNLSYDRWRAALEADGILVFEPSRTMSSRLDTTGQAQFLAGDTHWRPEAMQAVADDLGQLLGNLGLLTPFATQPIWLATPGEESQWGDLVAMLRLSDAVGVFPRETVTLRRVLQRNRSEWSPDLQAEVLLLGDSYTNIYSVVGMGWGTSAGLAEQLSLELNRPLDVLARNADGAHATRRQLARDLAAGTGRLANTRVVVWQFALRELASGDWPLISLPKARPPSTVPAAVGTITLTGTVLETSGVPTPGTVPYRDAVLSLHVTDSQGKELIVFAMGMRDNRLTTAAALKPGDRIRGRLVPWSISRKKYGRLNRIDLDDPDFELVDLPTFWGELRRGE